MHADVDYMEVTGTLGTLISAFFGMTVMCPIQAAIDGVPSGKLQHRNRYHPISSALPCLPA
jgi:hypothetical protein